MRPLLEMCQTNFRLHYTPGATISLDESTMAFKGHVRYDFYIFFHLVTNFQLDNKIHKHTHTHQLTLYQSFTFLQFNPNKPNKFHLKLFMVSEHASGYIRGFPVYTGKTANQLVAENATLDTHCSIMTKTVMGLLQRTRLLDNHRTVFFDNYFRYFTTPP